MISAVLHLLFERNNSRRWKSVCFLSEKKWLQVVDIGYLLFTNEVVCPERFEIVSGDFSSGKFTSYQLPGRIISIFHLNSGTNSQLHALYKYFSSSFLEEETSLCGFVPHWDVMRWWSPDIFARLGAHFIAQIVFTIMLFLLKRLL